MTASLAEAARDYRWLLDRGYPERGSATLVEDRRRLDAAERLALYRGVSSAAASRSRAAKRLGSIGGRILALDAYNALFLCANRLAGHFILIADDGFVRDAGGAHGRVADPTRFARAAELVADAVAAARPARVIAAFDSPVPRSAEHARAFAEALAARGVAAGTELARSADFAVKTACLRDGAVAGTGDSALVDSVSEAWDAGRAALEALDGSPPPYADFGVALGAGA